jgi:MFS transporter, DHA1 family, inner membrane transport protein
MAALFTVFLFGAAAFAIVPGLQLRVVDKGKGAPNLASAFNIAAFNVGSAGGAYLGGAALDSGFGLNAVPWVGALVTVVAISLTAFSWSSDRRGRRGDPTVALINGNGLSAGTPEVRRRNDK